MSNKEILYEYALKAVERFESKKINIFENGGIESLDDNGIVVERDSSKDYKTWVLNSLQEGQGIFLNLGQFEIYDGGSFEDASYEDFIFDDSYFEEGYLKELYREYYGFDDEEIYDELVEEEDYDFEDEPEATFCSIVEPEVIDIVCPVSFISPMVDFACRVGINVCKEDGEYCVSTGYTHIPDEYSHVVFEEWSITKDSIEDNPLSQLFAIVFLTDIVYEGEKDIEANSESILEILLDKTKKNRVAETVDTKPEVPYVDFEKEAEELYKSGKISNYLEHFERLNTTTESIYDLGETDVLIILKDGTNLTSWDKVECWKDVLYFSEDFSNKTRISRKYVNHSSVKAAVITGVTDKIRDMELVFKGCSSLVDLSGLETWDTSNVVDMNYMFKNCSSLKDLSFMANWDISKIEKLWNVFEGCSSLVDLSPLAGWDTSQIISMFEMFKGCSSLVDLSPLSNWDTSQVRNMSGMFSSCFSLDDISTLRNWDTSSLRKMEKMFAECYRLIDLSPLAGWDTSRVNSLISLFYNCFSLTDLSPLSNWDVSKVENLQNTFQGCSSLVDLSPLSNWDVSKVNNMWDTFHDCSSLVDLAGLETWNTSKVSGMRYMFESCSSLDDISALNYWDTSNVDEMIGMFKGCSSLVDLSPLANWDLSHVSDARGMFKDCSSLVDLSPLEDWSFSHICVMKSMFKGCSSLVDVSDLDWEIASMMNTIEIFDDCPNIEVYPSWYEE